MSDPDDGRVRLVRPTEQGRSLIAAEARQLRAMRRQWDTRLDGISVEAVLAALDVFIEVCEGWTSA